MPDRPEDQDNEPTRIVQRPGPKTVPLSVTPGPAPVHPSAATPFAPTPVAPPPTPVAPRGGPVEPPRASEDPEATRVAARPRLTPPGQPVQRVGAPPPNAIAPTPVAPPPFAPQPAAPPFAGPPPVAPQPVAPQAVAPQPIAPQPVAAPPIAPTPVAPAFPSMNEPPYAPPPAPPAPPAYQAPAAPPAPVAAPVLAEPKPAQRAERPDPVRSLPPIEPVVGWIVVIKGPGRGASREIFAGRNAIGSDPDQLIPIDFGDPAIARRGHAFIVYDNEGREFFIEDGKQKELVRLNGHLLSETRQIHHHDEIRIGQTTMKLVCLCGPEFDWADKNAPKSDAVPAEAPVPAKPAMAAAPVPEPTGPDAAGPEDAPMPPDQPGDI